MWAYVLKVLGVYFSAMIKFIFGPVGGFAAGFNLFVTILITIASTMTVVVAFAFFGEFIRKRIMRRFVNRKRRNKEPSKYDWVWRKYGLLGIAILTPVILTPIGGTLLAISVGVPRHRLIMSMLASASFWAIVLTITVYFFGEQVFPDFLK